jgi:hypothetical protein
MKIVLSIRTADFAATKLKVRVNVKCLKKQIQSLRTGLLPTAENQVPPL